ncbi:Efflux pump atB like protein [Verticillium longisporum]|nr:Efflux pump atB like protein [Verticillium longisporum]KAG7120332.1 Efflux pump atB like protein [Verticillium longisporum]CRK21245.1 hypothetical protein BN1723_012308 [Verticillium longisporum]
MQGDIDAPWSKGRPSTQEDLGENRQPTAPLALNANTPITYRYLSFDTLLPSIRFADIRFADIDVDAQQNLPPCPDDSKFGSPLQWPQHRKHLVLALSCAATFLTAYTSGSYSPPVAAMAEDLGSSNIAMIAGITTFCIGFALSPMVLAPISEIYGRRIVLVPSGITYVAFQAVCSVMPNLAGMLIARLFVGIGGAVFSSVIGGIIADMWTKDTRNTPMALFSGSVLAGTGAGPLLAAVMMSRIGNKTLAWKWVFWHQVIVDAVLVVLIVFFLDESRGSVLLSRKAKVLNEWYEALEDAGVYGCHFEEPEILSDSSDMTTSGSDEKLASCQWTAADQPSRTITTTVRLRWLVKEDEERASLAQLMKTSMIRPFHLLVAEPVVFFFSLWCAFAWAVLYCTFGTIPLAFSRVRGLNMEQSGYFFGSMIVGACVGTIVSIYQDRLLALPQWRTDSPVETHSAFWLLMRRRFPAEAPESRLYFTCLTATFLPVGLFLFGFTVGSDAHWIAPAFGIGLATWGIYSVYLATFNYFADIYHMYASSALAAQSFCRNLLGGAFPLVTGALFTNLGEARAGALLGGIATALTVIPWALVFFGQRIRSRSRFANALQPQQ